MLQRFEKQGFGIAAIKPESHFLKVGGKMLCRDLMPRTNDAALEQRERGLDAVRGDIAVHVDAVIWLTVLCCRESVQPSPVRAGYAVNSSVIITSTSSLTFSLMYFARVPDFRILSFEKSQFAAALLDAEDGLFF